MRYSGPFYLAIIETPKSEKRRMGVKKIDYKNHDEKILSSNYLFAFNGWYWFHKSLLSIFFSIDVKMLLRMETPVFVFSPAMNQSSLVRNPKLLGFYYKQTIAWLVRGILQ